MLKSLNENDQTDDFKEEMIKIKVSKFPNDDPDNDSS
jgi:hypothetical protein